MFIYGRNRTDHFFNYYFKGLFLMLSCPKCRKIKSLSSQERKKFIDEDGRETISCKACNHSYKRLPLSGSNGDGGDGGFG